VSIKRCRGVQENASLSLESGGDGHMPKAFQWQHVSGPARSLLWAGVTDSDQSPTLPTHMALEEENLRAHLKSLDTVLTSSSAKEDAIDLAEHKLQDYITDQLETLSKDVHKVNIQETDSIDNVEPTVGAPGPPGYHGSNGREGLTGLNGPTGSKGRPGPQGGAGKMGKSGVLGDQGPIGPEGQAGFAGPFPQRFHIDNLRLLCYDCLAQMLRGVCLERRSDSRTALRKATACLKRRSDAR